MTSPTLEPYREEIQERLRRGQSRAEIKRVLKETHGLTIGRTQFYDFVKQLSRELLLPVEEESIMPLREVKASESVREDETLRAFFVELPHALQEVTQKIDGLEQKIAEHKQTVVQALREFHETLSGMAKQLQERPAPLQPETVTVTEKKIIPFPAPVSMSALHRIWKRAFIVSGVAWGLVELLLVRGYWRPVWAAILRWV